jgi:hypothetical protein
MRSLLLLLATSQALAQTAPITIAIYAPNAPFESAADRFAFINRLAQQITSAAGVQAQGKAFARASDLEAAIKAKQVEFAVVDGIYLAERGVPYNVLATATSGGETQPRWALFSSTATSVQDLQGKKLTMANSGPRDAAFVENALFDGELQISKFFAARNTAPDISSAVAAVSLKKADAVFAPETQGKGLKKVFDAGKIPNAAFCEIGGSLASDVVQKIKQAVLGHGAAGPALDGWKAAGAGDYKTLAARMVARGRRPVMVEPEVVHLEEQDILVPPSLEPALPDVRTQYWTPTP